MEFRPLRVAREGRLAVFLREERRAAKPVGAVRGRVAGLPAAAALGPQRLDQGRHDGLGGISPSNDGKRLAYCVAEAGSDWSNWHVLDVDSGKVLADE